MWILKMQRLFEAALFEDEWGVAMVCECVLRGIRPSPSTVWDLPLRTVWWRLCLAQLKDAENSLFSERKCFCWEETCNFCASSNCCWLKRFTRSSTGSGRTLRSSNIFKILIFKYSYICQSTDATHSPHCQCWQQEPCWACDHLDQSEISIACVDQLEISIVFCGPIKDKYCLCWPIRDQ